MSIASRIAAVTLLASSVFVLSHAAAHADGTPIAPLSIEQRSVHDEATRSFRERRYSAAYARFARLADAGHAPSAQLALAMHANAAALFGSDWFATTAQQRRWREMLITAEFVATDDQPGE